MGEVDRLFVEPAATCDPVLCGLLSVFVTGHHRNRKVVNYDHTVRASPEWCESVYAAYAVPQHVSGRAHARLFWLRVARWAWAAATGGSLV